MTPVEITRGDGPVVLGLPHTGTFLPEDIRADLNDRGRQLTDTDWHIERLYDGLLPGATLVRATFHRYAIDANRAPDGESLYPGQNTTDLVPLTDFDGLPIWDREPAARRSTRPIMPPSKPNSTGSARVTAWRSSTTATRSAATSPSSSKARSPTSTSAPTAAPPAIPAWRPRS
jgi:hypothetical protein